MLFSLAGVVVSLLIEGAAFAVSHWACHHDEIADLAAPPAAHGTDAAPPGPSYCAVARWTSLGSMCTYLISFGVGMAPVPWTFNAEIYPQHVRATCMSVATAANWSANLLVSLTFLHLEDAITKPGAFWFYAAVGCAGAVWLGVAMPETAGKSFDQIEALFR